jgi:hypothetical protein
MTSDNKDDDDGGGEPTNNADAYRCRQKRYTIQEKTSIIQTVARLMERHGMTCSEACEDLNFTSGMHWAWKKLIEQQRRTISRQYAFTVEGICV